MYTTNTSQLNYANIQLDLESKNVDDLHREVLKVKQVVSEEKEVCENILAILELLGHKIANISVLATSNTKLDQRLVAISQFLSITTPIINKLVSKIQVHDYSILDKPSKSAMFTDNPKTKIRNTFSFRVASHEIPTWNFEIQTTKEKDIKETILVTTSFLKQVKEKGPSLSKDQINQFLVYVKHEPSVSLRINQGGETSHPILITMTRVSAMSANIQAMSQEPIFFPHC